MERKNLSTIPGYDRSHDSPPQGETGRVAEANSVMAWAKILNAMRVSGVTESVFLRGMVGQDFPATTIQIVVSSSPPSAVLKAECHVLVRFVLVTFLFRVFKSRIVFPV